MLVPNYSENYNNRMNLPYELEIENKFKQKSTTAGLLAQRMPYAHEKGKTVAVAY